MLITKSIQIKLRNQVKNDGFLFCSAIINILQPSTFEDIAFGFEPIVD